MDDNLVKTFIRDLGALMILHVGHVDTPEKRGKVDEWYLKQWWNNHEVYERYEGPHAPASEHGGP